MTILMNESIVDFILCEYLCVIQEKRQDMEVMGLKSIDQSKREHILKENDISSVTVSQVIWQTPQPQIVCKDKKMSYLFKTNLQVQEI